MSVAADRVIYRLLEQTEGLQSSLAPLEEVAEPSGTAEVLKLFSIKGKKKGDAPVTVAGCKVVEGSVLLGGQVLEYRVLRSGQVVWRGPIKTLKHLQHEVPEVKKDTECGIMLDGFERFEVGDRLQCCITIQRPVRLTRESTEL